MNPKLLLDINKTSYYLHDNLCELVISNIKKKHVELFEII